MPVMFAPGRAKLATIPSAMGSALVQNTIGPVLPACRSEGISRVRSHDKIEIEPHQLGGLRGCELVRLTARPAVFDHDVLAFYVAKLAQPLPERLDGRQGGGTNVGS